jgi:hypothetical protein
MDLTDESLARFSVPTLLSENATRLPRLPTLLSENATRLPRLLRSRSGQNRHNPTPS